ncbi:MAG TPA: hypothetical protein VI815_02890 [Candidatus Nanoarchaeia archaeon]|nr:hypothetical protein [Candidatus Nanoarchaeia archaeon]
MPEPVKKRMTIGTTAQQREMNQEPENYLDDQIKLAEGNNLLRIVQGPFKIKTVFYPSIKETEENNEKFYAPTLIALNFLESGGVVDTLFSIESIIRSGLGDKGEVGWKPQLRWWFFALNLQERGEKKVRAFKATKGIRDDIKSLEESLDPLDPTFLLNGPFFLYPILINKSVDPTKPKKFGTKYTVSVYDNQWKSQIPADWLNATSEEIIDSLGVEKIFTEDEINAINSCEIDLDEIIKPMNELEIKEKLMKFPMNLKGLKVNSADFFYPQVPEFEEQIKTLGLPTVKFDFKDSTSKVKVGAQSSIKTSGDESPRRLSLSKKETPAEENVVDAVYTDVKSETPPAEVETKTKIEPKPADEAPKKRTLGGLKKNNL